MEKDFKPGDVVLPQPPKEGEVCGFCNGQGIPPDDDTDGEQASPNGEQCPVCGQEWEGVNNNG